MVKQNKLHFGEYTAELSELAKFDKITQRIRENITKGKKLWLTVYEYNPEPSAPKTLNQLRYLHGIVFKGMQEAYKQTGEFNPTKEWCKRKIKSECGWGETFVCECKNKMIFQEKSFKEATKEELVAIIETAIQLCAERGVEIPEPKKAEEYFK